MYCLIKEWPNKMATLMMKMALYSGHSAMWKKHAKYGKTGVLFKMTKNQVNPVKLALQIYPSKFFKHSVTI